MYKYILFKRATIQSKGGGERGIFEINNLRLNFYEINK